MSFPTQSAMLGSTKFVDTALGIAGVVDQDAIMRDVDNGGVSLATFQPLHIPPSNASPVADNQLRLFCFILFRSKNSFLVKVEKDKAVEDLRSAIIDKARLENDNFELFKPPQPVTVVELQAIQVMNAEWQMLYNDESLQKHFNSPLQLGIHIVIRFPSEHTFRIVLAEKHTLTWSSDDPGVNDKKPRKQQDVSALATEFFHLDVFRKRKWMVNGAIRSTDVRGHYYLDVSQQKVTESCLDAVDDSLFVLLSGARSSGKSTRLNVLEQTLIDEYEVIHVSFQSVGAQDTVESFWDTFSFSAPRFGKVSSSRDFLQKLRSSRGEETYVVLLIDEFSSLHGAHPDVRDSFLNVFRDIRNSSGKYVIRSIIAAGIYSITYLRTGNKSISPFNSSIHIQNSNFTLEEVGQLFRDFAKDSNIQIDNDIIQDVFNKTNGHAGLVCLCGRTIQRNLKSFLVDRSLSNEAWQKYPADALYETISLYNTFDSMINSLLNLKADPAITLLRRRFLGYLDDVDLNDDDKASADLLTSEGVLLKPYFDRLCYRMASPLVDGLIRTKLLCVLYPLTPLGPPLLRGDRSLDAVETLKKAVALFDGRHMAEASQMSFKSSGSITVNSMKKCYVPRESVYIQELMRILSNWLTPFGWEVIGQWHMLNDLGKHKYTDVTLKGVTGQTILFKLVATGTETDLDSHLKKVPEYAKLQSATEVWTIHFTCQDNFTPIKVEGANVLHFVHDLDWKMVVVYGHWNDHTGCTRLVEEVVVGHAALSYLAGEMPGQFP